MGHKSQTEGINLYDFLSLNLLQFLGVQCTPSELYRFVFSKWLCRLVAMFVGYDFSVLAESIIHN